MVFLKTFVSSAPSHNTRLNLNPLRTALSFALTVR